MEIIPLDAVPSQRITVVLAAQTCQINVYQKSTGLFVDLYVNNTLIIGGVMALNGTRLVRDPYLAFFGDLIFYDLQGITDPVYTGLGTRFALAFLTPAEVATDAAAATASSLAIVVPLANLAPTPTGTPPTIHAESAEGTPVTTPGGLLYDANNHSYTYNAAGQIVTDGVPEIATSSVQSLYYHNHQLYWQDMTGNWFTRLGPTFAFTLVNSPIAVESADGTQISTVGPVLYDAAINRYGLAATGLVLVNGTPDTTTASAKVLYYRNHAVFWQNASGTWFSRAVITSPWTQTVAPTAIESLDKTSVSTVGPAITDAALNSYTISAGAQLVTNGVAEIATANIAQLYYLGHALYTRNTSNVWQTRTGPAAAFVTVASPILVESANRTAVTTVGPTIVDAALNTYAINAAGQIVTNGTADPNTSLMTDLYYSGHLLYVHTSTNVWSSHAGPGAAYVVTTSPIPVESADKTLVTAVGPTITTAAFNVYAITSNRVVSINGVVDASTGAIAAVTEIYYRNHLVYRLDGTGAWNYQTAPATAWIVTTSPIPTESPEGTNVNTVGPVLTMSNLDTYGLSAGQQVVFNGTPDPKTNSATRLYMHLHVPYQQNSLGAWYVNTVPATFWATASSPLPAVASESPDPTSITTVGPVITDASLNTYGFNTSGTLIINGTPNASSNGTTRLYYHNHIVYLQGTGGLWYRVPGPGVALVQSNSPLNTESADPTSVSTVGPIIVTAALDTYALGSGGQIIVNLTAAAGIANAFRLYYHTHAIFYQVAGTYNWLTQTGPTAAWTAAATPFPFTESPDPTSVTTVGPVITDAAGNVYSLNGTAQVVTNSVADTTTANAVRLYYTAHAIYHLNTAGNWYSKSSAAVAWAGPVGSPLPAVLVESGEGASVATIGPVIVTASLETYGLNAAQQVMFNKVADTTTSGVVRLYYHNHQPYQLNTAGNWYSNTVPKTVWTGPVASPLPAPVGGTGFFKVSGGRIQKPDGTDFHAKGVNLTPTGGSNVQFSLLQSLYPGINIFRLVLSVGQDMTAANQFIASATAANCVCVIDNHNTGSLLDAGMVSGEVSWYGGIASQYASNPYVWFNTCNEPSGSIGQNGSDASMLVREHVAVYNAIRGAGNQGIVLFSQPGGGYTTWTSYAGTNYSAMTNVGWSCHFYGYLTYDHSNPPFSIAAEDIASTQSAFNNEISDLQVIRSADGIMPAVIDEFGPSTSGGAGTTDHNGAEVVRVVLASPWGFIAWAQNGTGHPLGDGLMTEETVGTTFETYGQTVANRIAQLP